MFFELNEKQRLFQKKVREVYEREVSPWVEEYEKKATFPVFLYPLLGANRLLCLRCPEKYGGPGLDKVSECISMEELNRICAGIGASIMVHGGLATDPLLRYGSEDLKQRVLTLCGSGRKNWCLCLDGTGCRIGCLWDSDDRFETWEWLSYQWFEEFYHQWNDLRFFDRCRLYRSYQEGGGNQPLYCE